MAAADALLAKEFGVSEKIVADFRTTGGLVEGLHWTRESAQGRVSFADTARDRLSELLAVEKKEAPEMAAQRDVPLEILRLLPNPRWVRVRTPAGTIADVQVKPSTHLKPRVRLRCSYTDGAWKCTHHGFVPL